MRLLLLGTLGCHLCEQAEDIVKECSQQHGGVTIEQVDIAESEQWQTHYATRIPVLFHPDTAQDLGWPFDHTQVEKFMSELNHG